VYHARAKTNDYETGMKVTYEPRSQTVIVAFRGRLQVLPGRYPSESEGLTAGESFCRVRGWRPERQTPSLRSAW
jgi:hypothetical protein